MVLEHSESDVEELAHDGADDAHFGLASCTQSQGKVAQRGVVFDRYQGRHVEGLAQITVAFLA